jgi:2,3-bisphosphoglycerate-dependent phosphoglycerate mutase
MRQPSETLEKGLIVEILLVRHARPLTATVVSGQPDPDLDDVGRSQAQLLSEALVQCPVAAIYSSTLRRAIQTAAPLAAALGTPVRTDPDLVELSLGEDHYFPHNPSNPDPVAAAHIAEWMGRLTSPENAAAITAFRTRVGCAIARIQAAHPKETVLVSTHLMVINAVLTTILGIDELTAFEPSYTSVSRITVAPDGRARVLSVNERL